jgi:hypothetical protein
MEIHLPSVGEIIDFSFYFAEHISPKAYFSEAVFRKAYFKKSISYFDL